MNNDKKESKKLKIDQKYRIKFFIFILMASVFAAAVLKVKFFDDIKNNPPLSAKINHLKTIENNDKNNVDISQDPESKDQVEFISEKLSDANDEIKDEETVINKNKNPVKSDLMQKISQLENEVFVLNSNNVEYLNKIKSINKRIKKLEYYENKAFKINAIFALIDKNISKIKEKMHNGGNVNNEIQFITNSFDVLGFKIISLNALLCYDFLNYLDFEKSVNSFEKKLLDIQNKKSNYLLDSLLNIAKYNIIKYISIKYNQDEMLFSDNIFRYFLNFKRSIELKKYHTSIDMIDLLELKINESKDKSFDILLKDLSILKKSIKQYAVLFDILDEIDNKKDHIMMKLLDNK